MWCMEGPAVPGDRYISSSAQALLSSIWSSQAMAIQLVTQLVSPSRDQAAVNLLSTLKIFFLLLLLLVWKEGSCCGSEEGARLRVEGCAGEGNEGKRGKERGREGADG